MAASARLDTNDMEVALFNKVAKALSDPQRFAILERIARESAECPCIKLVEGFAITQATISHHLKELANAELIDVRREGKCAHFSIRRDTLDAYRAELSRRLAIGEGAAVGQASV